jgi:hypothetical protein
MIKPGRGEGRGNESKGKDAYKWAGEEEETRGEEGEYIAN